MKVTGAYSRQWIQGFVNPPPDSVIISIRNPADTVPKLSGFSDVLYLEMWDLTEPRTIELPFGKNTIILPPSKDQMDMVYHYIADNQHKSIFAQCPAGISRSGAIREFLDRHGWHMFVGQRSWPIAPNIYILNELNRRQRDLGLIEVKPKHTNEDIVY